MRSLKDKYKKCASLMEGTPLFMRGNIELKGKTEDTPNANRQKRLTKIQANRAASGQFKEDNYLPRSRSLKEGLVTKYNPKTGLYELRDNK